MNKSQKRDPEKRAGKRGTVGEFSAKGVKPRQFKGLRTDTFSILYKGAVSASSEDFRDGLRKIGVQVEGMRGKCLARECGELGVAA